MMKVKKGYTRSGMIGGKIQWVKDDKLEVQCYKKYKFLLNLEKAQQKTERELAKLLSTCNEKQFRKYIELTIENK